MDTKMMKIADLKAAEYNPRKISDVELEKLKESIRQYGVVEPVVVNTHEGRENVIVGGHQTVRACEQVDVHEVPCVMVSLDPTRERLLNLGLNKIKGKWENGLLSELMVSLNEEGAELGLSGFDETEIARLVGDYGSRQDEADVEVPELQNRCAKCGYEW